MARISGINLPHSKRVVIALTYIYGIGHTSAAKICELGKIGTTRRVKTLSEDEISRLREIIAKQHTVEGDLRKIRSMNIKNLKDIKCYRGLRHIRGLPVRGQSTHSNARTRKGKAVPIAGKKKAVK